MRFIIQRVSQANVVVNHNCIGKINQGLVVFIGISEEDTEDIANKMIQKLLGLRIFADENDKINLGIKQINGSLLLISQFTLYADCKKGNRPSFGQAGNPIMSKKLYDYVIKKCKNEILQVEQGEFGADMQVSLINDGPFTIHLDSKDIYKQ